MNKFYTSTIFFYLIIGSFTIAAQAPFRYFTDINGDQLYDIKPVGQNGFITCGMSPKINASYGDACVIRFNNIGDTLWSRIYDFGSPNGEVAISAIPLNDGTIIIAGTAYPTSFIMKLDSVGNTLWSKTYDSFYIRNAILTSDNKIAITGGASGCLFCKMDLNGNILLLKRYPAPGYGVGGIHLKEALNGDFIIAGQLDYGLSEAFAMRIDANGTLLWDKTYFQYMYWAFNDVIETKVGDLIFVGMYASQVNSSQDLLMVKTNANGNLVWSKTFSNGNYSRATSLAKTSNNTFIASGDVLLSSDENGNIQWSKKPNGIVYASTSLNTGSVAFAGVTFTSKGQVFVADANGNTGCMDANDTLSVSTISCAVRNASATASALNVSVTASNYTVYVGPSTFKPCSIVTGNEEMIKTKFQIFPNPFLSTLTIKRESGNAEELLIKDVMGKTVLKREISSGELEITLTTDVPKGVYFLQMGNQTVKLLKL